MINIDLNGKVALIAGGGAGGIGSAVTLALAKAGATIAALDISDELNGATRRELSGQNFACETFTTDLTDPAAAAGTIEAVLSRMGQLDILVNVAGGTRQHQWRRLEESPDSLIKEVFALNLDYVIRLGADAARHMIARGKGGSIVNFASISGLRSAAFHGPYGAAKAAVSAITQTMAIEWAQHGIRVNAIAPGSVTTPRILKYYDGKDPHANPDGRRSINPSEIANAVLFLVSDLASGITGQTLTIDAGMSCRNPAGDLDYFGRMVIAAEQN